MWRTEEEHGDRMLGGDSRALEIYKVDRGSLPEEAEGRKEAMQLWGKEGSPGPRRQHTKDPKCGSSLVLQWVNDPVLSLQWLSHCCGMCLFPGLGTITCLGLCQNKQTEVSLMSLRPEGLCGWKEE